LKQIKANYRHDKSPLVEYFGGFSFSGILQLTGTTIVLTGLLAIGLNFIPRVSQLRYI
jgi:hypothetical protein